MLILHVSSNNYLQKEDIERIYYVTFPAKEQMKPKNVIALPESCISEKANGEDVWYG